MYSHTNPPFRTRVYAFTLQHRINIEIKIIIEIVV